MRIGKRAEALILSFEGWDVPWQWPGGSSGITLPIGYDLGYEPFAKDWAGLLAPADFNRLNAVVGLRGERAHAAAPGLRGIHIPRDAALHVFENVTLPRYEDLTIYTFPGSDAMPPDAFGALVSLVFNRGASLEDKPGMKPRGEMRAIRDLLQAGNPGDPQTLLKIADQIAAQAKYWADNPNSDGDLHDRRIDEAKLVGDCAQ